MRLTLKLFAVLAERLPPGSRRHTTEVEVRDGTTVRDLIEQMRIPPELAQLVLIDGTHLTRTEIEQRPLREGETVAIFPPIAGG
jgi:sulfur carrier protein ThiS